MTLTEAYDSCKQGNFVSNRWFDYTQSMHEFNGEFYYEDGGRPNAIEYFDLSHEEWAKDGWFIAIGKEDIDFIKLGIMHNEYKDKMLPQHISYNQSMKNKMTNV